MDTKLEKLLIRYLEQRRAEVERALAEWLPGEEPDCPSALREAMAYSLLAGGKRLRPILVLAAAEACGGPRRRALPAACALEYVHTYSLIHDDLPAMDDDDFRRGRPTSHRVFGEAMAILAGDALLTRAFEIMAVGGTLEPVIRVALIRELAAAAGSDGMVGGQVVDMESEGKAVDRETVLYIHRHKTGALITAAVRLGAISAGADRSLLGKLTTYGRNLGAAFQIVDDLLDEEGDLPSLGKTPGSDRRKGKATWPAVAGVEDSRREAAALAAKARRALAGLDRGRILTALIDHVLTRRS